jgi:hypothetical protein
LDLFLQAEYAIQKNNKIVDKFDGPKSSTIRIATSWMEINTERQRSDKKTKWQKRTEENMELPNLCAIRNTKKNI